jgi:hypothetical protein
MREFLIGLFAVGILVCLGWGFEANYLARENYFAPRFEAVRRNTFEQSKAYNQGMIQNLRQMQFAYDQADDAHKQALADIILHDAADYDVDVLPDDLRTFVRSLRSNWASSMSFSAEAGASVQLGSSKGR